MTLIDKKFEEVFKIVYPQTPQDMPKHHKALLKIFFVAGMRNGAGLTSKIILSTGGEGISWLTNSLDIAIKQAESDLNSSLT